LPEQSLQQYDKTALNSCIAYIHLTTCTLFHQQLLVVQTNPNSAQSS